MCQILYHIIIISSGGQRDPVKKTASPFTDGKSVAPQAETTSRL